MQINILIKIIKVKVKNKMGNFEEEVKEEFINENIDSLINDFIKVIENEFNEFLDNCIIDEDRDLEYWKEIFCKEEREEEFNDFCNDCFNEYQDEIETRRSLINDIYS